MSNELSQLVHVFLVHLRRMRSVKIYVHGFRPLWNSFLHGFAYVILLHYLSAGTILN